MSQDERAPKYSDLFGSNHDHPSDCAYCPICATISVVRSTRPEVLEHVAAAAKELITAFGMMLEEAGQVAAAAEAAARTTAARGSGTDDPKIRRIDIG